MGTYAGTIAAMPAAVNAAERRQPTGPGRRRWSKRMPPMPRASSRCGSRKRSSHARFACAWNAGSSVSQWFFRTRWKCVASEAKP
jgi:hypothetical protein